MTRPTSRPVTRRGFIRSAGATAGLVAGGAWLAGCAPTIATPPSKPAASATSAPAGAPAVAKPASASTLKIGVLLPYSGVYAVLGESITNGMQMYFDSANNTAGGRAITLVKEDEGATPDDGLRKARKLLEQDQVDLIAGTVSTAIAYAIRDLVIATR